MSKVVLNTGMGGKTVVTILIFAVLLSVGGLIFLYTQNKSVSAELSIVNTRLKDEAALAKDLQKRVTESDVREQKLRDEARQDREKKDAEIAQLQADKSQLATQLVAEKAKTATLTNSELAANIGAYIGVANIAERKDTGFSLTRPGAENSLNIFKDYTFTLAQWEKDKDTVKKQEDKILTYEVVTIPSYKKQLGEMKGALDAANTALTDTNASLSLTKKDANKKFLSGLLYGVGGTSLVVLILILANGLGT